MQKKIVAIGGGENGRIKTDGTRKLYETANIDLEIIRLTKKLKPNYLFLGHSQNEPESEQSYFETMKRIYGDMYGCECRTITRKDLTENISKVLEYIEWADIIYEGGGDTKSMVELWRSTGFDEILKEAWENGKVMCGVSAGGNCWFKLCSSDSLKIQLQDDTAPLIEVEGLGFINAFFVPHCDIATETTNRLAHMKEALKENNMVGIAMSNCAAIEIVDDKYKMITCDASNHGITAYGLKSYWKDGEYIEEFIDTSDELKELESLLNY